MFEVWLSAKELVERTGPPLPQTEHGWRKRLRSEQCPEKTVGRVTLFDTRHLPMEMRLEIAGGSSLTASKAAPIPPQARTCGAAILDPEKSLKALAGLGGRQREITRLRLVTLHAFESFIEGFEGPFMAALSAFEGTPEAGDASARTIRRWRDQYQRYGAAGLVPVDRHKASKTDPLTNFLIGLVGQRPGVSASVAHDLVRAHFGEAPSKKTIQRRLKDIRQSHKRAIRMVSDPDGYKNTYRAAAGSADEDVVRLNQRFELDSSPVDLMLNGPDGQMRYQLIGCLEVFSRRACFVVSKTSTAASVAACLRKAILAFGVPEEVKTDNGADYTSHHIQTVLRELEIKHSVCTPFSPEQKPYVERVFKTFQHGLVSMLDGFVGHSVAERSKIEATKAFSRRLGEDVVQVTVTPEEMQGICDTWCAGYHDTAHSGIGDKTPNQVVAGWPLAVAEIKDERALDLLLAKSETRVVGKKGISIGGVRYDAPALGAIVGDTVQVRIDEADISQVFVYFEGAFLCKARDLTLPSVSIADVAAAKRSVQKEAEKISRADMRAKMRGVNTHQLAMKSLLDKAKVAGSVTPLRPNRSEHSTPALRATAEAARPHEEVRPQGSPQATADVVTAPLDPVARALKLHARIEAGEHVSAEDQDFYSRVSRAPKFRAALAMRDDDMTAKRRASRDGETR